MEQENVQKQPSVNRRIDVKSITLHTFAAAIKALRESKDDFAFGPRQRIQILATFGTVSGEVEDVDYDPDEESSRLNDAIFNIRNDYLVQMEEEMGKDPYVVNNSSVVVLRDVVVRPFSNPDATSCFEKLYLFADQVVGFTYGEEAP